MNKAMRFTTPGISNGAANNYYVVCDKDRSREMQCLRGARELNSESSAAAAIAGPYAEIAHQHLLISHVSSSI